MIDTSRVGDGDKNKAQPGVIRHAIKEELRKTEDQATWRCAAVIRGARNTERIKVVYKDEAALQPVKKAAQRTVVTGVPMCYGTNSTQ
jgi:hypothetical protein